MELRRWKNEDVDDDEGHEWLYHNKMMKKKKKYE